MEYVSERILEESYYILNNNSTVRKTAKAFGVSKSTVHNDLTKKLKKINLIQYNKIKILMQKNFMIKHIRGGQATKIKYENINKNKLNNKLKINYN